MTEKVNDRSIYRTRYIPDIEGRDCEGSFIKAKAVRHDDPLPAMPAADLPNDERVPEVRESLAQDANSLASCAITQELQSSVHRSVPTGHRTLSDRALALVNGPRQEAYGEPTAHAAKVAGVWRSMFGWDVDAHKFALAMTALKLVREANRPKQDSRTDAVGWLEIADRIVATAERLR